MDIIDTAAEIEELQRNAALSAHRLNRNAVSAERCAECGEDIPAPRRASFWEFTMQSNPMTWLIAALMALGALISFIHEPEGVQWLLLIWAH